MTDFITIFCNDLLQMKPCRKGSDFFENESETIMCFETLLNQRVSIERATAITYAIHDYFGRPFEKSTFQISNISKYPYEGIAFRRAGKSLYNLIRNYFDTRKYSEYKIADLPSGIIGAMASLERYHNRENEFFQPLRDVVLTIDQVESLTPEKVCEISQVKLPAENLRCHLNSIRQILNMKISGLPQQILRKELLKLERVGDETADTLLVYLFRQPAIIVDEYLKRILYRHYLLQKQFASRRSIVDLLGDHIKTWEDAHTLHARINEIGVLYCHATAPDCENCPLGRSVRRE
ncbi:MAG: hypothetical protein IBX72_11515 [Nitrospirae bacterium]|nr:hypothetical protein [Nitrospirota bacterium]